MTGRPQYTGQHRTDAQQRAQRAEQARRVAASVSEKSLRETVEKLARPGPRNSATAPAAHSAAADMIESQLRQPGCKTERQVFQVPRQEPAREGVNVIGTLTPTADAAGAGPAVLIGAHFDTVPCSPGADDNASGVAAMLECARVLSGVPRRRTVMFVAFDAEEKQPPEEGLHGSIAYVKSLKPDVAIGAAYILEMVGYSAPEGGQKIPRGFQLLFPRAFDSLRADGFGGTSLVAITNARSRRLGRDLEQAAASWSDGLRVLPVELPGWMPVPRNLRRSDHAPFWQAGIPAVMIGDTANFRNPHYHLPTDIADTLDYELLTMITRTLAGLVAWEAA